MPAAMGMTLFFLLFGGIWTQEMTPGSLHITTALEMSVPGGSSASLVSTFSESPNLNLVTPNPMTTRVPEKGNSTRHQISPPSSDLYTANEMSFPEASTAATNDLHVPESTVFWEVSTKESSNLEINANSIPAEPPRKSLALHVMTDGTMATGSLETSDVAGGPPVTMATGSLETSDVAGGPPVTMATGSLETSDVDGGPPVTMATGSLETSDVAGGPPVTMATGSLETSDVAGGPPVTMATGSLETSDVTGGPPVTMATGSLETSDVAGGPPVTMATGSLETSDVDGGPPVTMATGSLETSDVDGGAPVTMATGSLETSDVDGGAPVTMATGSLETSDVTGGPPVTMATGSLPIPKGTSDSPISMVKIPTVTTSASSKNRSSTQLSDQGTKGTLLVAVFVALLVVIVLVVLLLLWRQRQKRRTGALTLSRGGKRNGVVDAGAGPAQVPDEEALTAIAVGSGAEKGSGGPEGEGAGRQPTLTTFLDRGKSQQCSLGLEELKAGSAPLLKGEVEPLVGSKDEASEQPEAGEVEAPQCL
ncbi:leukosialin [Mirounga angustirostris]|uniref:leukosialin n=1 Tax=Mirounga angustirostris TaxID=9716 RepID=UPI00313DEC00